MNVNITSKNYETEPKWRAFMLFQCCDQLNALKFRNNYLISNVELTRSS